MIKFLINLASLVLCFGILAFGGFQTVSAMQIDDMMSEIQAALDSSLLLPGVPEKGFDVEVPAGSTAVLDENTVLKTEDVTETITPAAASNVSALFGEKKETGVLIAYDVSLLLDGNSVQPGGTVKVTLPMPDGADSYDSLEVVYIADNGAVTRCETTVNADRTVSFLADHFSCYAIIGVNDVEESTPEHTHSFIAGKCECGEVDPDYVPPHEHKFTEGKCECGEVDHDYVPPHEHKFTEGKCECGETNPNYNPHKHSYVNGKCECGESDPDYVPPHVHAYVNGVCSCGAKNPYHHWHSYVNGKCSCGALDPDHVHEYTEGKCVCGASDPNYKPGLSTEEAKDSFANMYDSYDPDFKELNKEFFMGMVNGALGNNTTDDEPEEPDTPDVPDTPDEPDEPEIPDFDIGFDEEFNPDDYVPEQTPDAPEEDDDGETNVNDLIVDVAGTYFDKLQEGIQSNIEANKDATEEEKKTAQEEFVQKEADAFAGLLNVVTKPEETTEETIVDSVGAIVDSNVCLDTVTESIQKNESLTTTVQDATAGMNEETKTQIEDKINEALAANPEKEQQYKDLANLFGITLGEGGVPSIPGDVVIPGIGG